MKHKDTEDSKLVLKKPAAAKPPKPAAAKPAAGKPKAIWHDEVARSQILCRCGKGAGSTKSIMYGKHSGNDHGSKAKAIEKAKAWCKSKQ